MSAPNTYSIVVAGQHGPVAECLQSRSNAEGLNVELIAAKDGTIVSAVGEDGRSEWSVTLSPFQTFQSASMALITYGTIDRDAFHREIWPLIEYCETTNIEAPHPQPTPLSSSASHRYDRLWMTFDAG